MADIIIRGMEEPMRCSACRMLEGDTDDGLCHAANKWFDDEWFRWYQYPEGDIATDKPLNCPLVPLPEGHGRLIDADALCAGLVSNHPVVIYAKNAPTIIEADLEWKMKNCCCFSNTDQAEGGADNGT